MLRRYLLLGFLLFLATNCQAERVESTVKDLGAIISIVRHAPNIAASRTTEVETSSGANLLLKESPVLSKGALLETVLFSAPIRKNITMVCVKGTERCFNLL